METFGSNTVEFASAPHHFVEQPLLEALLSVFKALPCASDVRNELAFSWHVSWTTRKTQLCLQRVEVRLKLCLLLNTWRLVTAPVSSIFFQLLSNCCQRIIRLPRRQPWQSTADPFQQLKNTYNYKLTFKLNNPLLRLLTSLASRSYSSIRRSFSWFTRRTLQIRLAAVSAYS